MRTGIFGGTFDPVHMGHLLIAEEARQRYGLTRMIFVPAAQSPFKEQPKASASHRLAMLRAALRGNPVFTLSDWEIRQKRVVYTYETLDYFCKRLPGDRLYFLVGADAHRSLSTWKQARRLKTLAKFIAAPRLAPFASREIRRRAARKQSIRYQVPDSVERYIRRHHLYRA